jgi:hypothetical protein
MARSEQVIGDGINTVFDIDVGFSTADPAVQCFDLFRSGNIVMAFQMQEQTPNATSVRLTLTPAPGVNSIRVVVTDGTEDPI